MSAFAGPPAAIFLYTEGRNADAGLITTGLVTKTVVMTPA
jgi:hypothetical protein